MGLGPADRGDQEADVSGQLTAGPIRTQFPKQEGSGGLWGYRTGQGSWKWPFPTLFSEPGHDGGSLGAPGGNSGTY